MNSKNAINIILALLIITVIGFGFTFISKIQHTSQTIVALNEKVDGLKETVDILNIQLIETRFSTEPTASGVTEEYTDACANVSVNTCEIAKNLGKGINLGDVFDAPFEGKWKQTFKDHYVGEIAARFNTVRLPVKWSNHAAKTADAALDETFFKRIEYVIDLFLEHGMYVILDLHHYNQLVGKPVHNGEFWVDANVIDERFYNIWKQLSYKLKDKPEKLIFEILNEPNKRMTAEKLNAMYPIALASIREHNPERVVMLSHSGFVHTEESLDKFQLPDDQNVMFDFHTYIPNQFTHQGLSYLPQYPAGVKCCSPYQQNKIQERLDVFSSWSKKVGIPGFIGEWGSTFHADEESRINYTKFKMREIERRGMSWAIWQFSGNFGLYDSDTDTWNTALEQALTEDISQELYEQKQEEIQDLELAIQRIHKTIDGESYRAELSNLALDAENGISLTKNQASRLSTLSKRMVHEKAEEQLTPLREKVAKLKIELDIDINSAAQLQSHKNHSAKTAELIAEAKALADWSSFKQDNKNNWTHYSQEIKSFGKDPDLARKLYWQYIKGIRTELSAVWRQIKEINNERRNATALMAPDDIASYYASKTGEATRLIEKVAAFNENQYNRLEGKERQLEILTIE